MILDDRSNWSTFKTKEMTVSAAVAPKKLAYMRVKTIANYGADKLSVFLEGHANLDMLPNCLGEMTFIYAPLTGCDIDKLTLELIVPEVLAPNDVLLFEEKGNLTTIKAFRPV